MSYEILIAIACIFIGFACALVAGVLQSFSDFVMNGLLRADWSGGMQVMQQINVTVMKSVFLVLLLGLVPVTIAAAAFAWSSLGRPESLLMTLGAGLYTLGVMGVTMIGNVPMNNRLAGFDAGAPGARDYWQTYGAGWTRLNHVRTLASMAAALSFLAAALMLAMPATASI